MLSRQNVFKTLFMLIRLVHLHLYGTIWAPLITTTHGDGTRAAEQKKKEKKVSDACTIIKIQKKRKKDCELCRQVMQKYLNYRNQELETRWTNRRKICKKKKKYNMKKVNVCACRAKGFTRGISEILSFFFTVASLALPLEAYFHKYFWNNEHMSLCKTHQDATA